MKLLTDTHALVWALETPVELGPLASTALSQHAFTASALNFWELVIRKDKPRALIRDPVAWWQKYVLETGIPTLTVHIDHIRKLAELPKLHRDPFDRLLVAQALSDGFTIVTKDAQLARYNAPVVW